MIQPGFVASSIRVDAVREAHGLLVRYAVDDWPRQTIEIPVGDTSEEVLAFLVACSAVYLGSICLAEVVTVKHRLPAGLLDGLSDVAEMLYDIRRWRDELPLGGPPMLRAVGAPVSPTVSEVVLDPCAAVGLWSGGKDSTLALLALQANGYVAHPIHVTVNAGAEAAERQAVDRLTRLIALDPVEHVTVRHDDFPQFSARYSQAWNTFPLSNQVPFGRDLFLMALAVPLALRKGASCISVGHDHECRNAVVEYRGKVIPRNDLESARAALQLEQVIQRFVHPGLRLMPPVATITELRILRDMLLSHPDLMAQTSFCFWGRSCGRCGKCLRYFLADRYYQTEILRFEVNPLSKGACPELDEVLNDPSVLFHKEVLLLLGRLAQRNDVRPGEDVLAEFGRSRLSTVESHLDEWETELLAEYHDPQVPSGFSPSAASPEESTKVPQSAGSGAASASFAQQGMLG